jgi:hypothetical protein
MEMEVIHGEGVGQKCPNNARIIGTAFLALFEGKSAEVYFSCWNEEVDVIMFDWDRPGLFGNHRVCIKTYPFVPGHQRRQATVLFEHT